MPAAMGNLAQLGIGTANPVTVGLDFQSESLVYTQSFLDATGARGTRSRQIGRVREGPAQVTGGISLIPTPVEMASLIPWNHGAAAVGTSYPLGETLTSRYVTIDRVSKVFTYDSVMANRFTWSAAPGDFLKLDIDCLGIGETIGNAGTFPALTIDSTTKPFLLTDAGTPGGGSTTVNGTSVCTQGFSLTVDNFLTPQTYTNCAAGPTQLVTTDRLVQVTFLLSYGDYSALYNLGAGGVPVVITIIQGALSIVWTMSKVVFERRAPNVVNRNGEILLALTGIAYKDGSTMELTTVLDSTP